MAMATEANALLTAVIDAQRHVVGIFTDGDLRRCIARAGDLRAARVTELMTRQPRTIGPDRLAIDCIELMEAAPKVMQPSVRRETLSCSWPAASIWASSVIAGTWSKSRHASKRR